MSEDWEVLDELTTNLDKLVVQTKRIADSLERLEKYMSTRWGFRV